MGKLFIGNTGYKMTVGNTKIKRAYLGNTLIYSDDVTVVYHLDDSIPLTYTEYVDEGADCLTPKSFNPVGVKPEYTFLGWRLDDQPVNEVLSTCTATGSTEIHLYAVFYNTYTVNFYNASTTKITKTYMMYYNNGNRVHPKISAEDMTLKAVSSFKNALGWTDVLNSFTQKYANGVSIEIKSNLDLYSIYTQNSTLYIYNGSESGSIKSVFTATRNRQYNSSAVYTVNPSITLKHNDIAGWNNEGWTTVKDSTVSTINDGLLNITEAYDGKSLYALYSKQVEMYIINGENRYPDMPVGAKSTITAMRYRQMIADKVNVIDPTIILEHNEVRSERNSYVYNGWNLGDDNQTPVAQDGDFKFSSEYDGKTLYALYISGIMVTWNTSVNIINNYEYKEVYFRMTESSRHITAPKFRQKIKEISGWDILGWSDSEFTEFPTTATYGDNEVFSRTTSVTLFPYFRKEVKLTATAKEVTTIESKYAYYKPTNPNPSILYSYPSFTIPNPSGNTETPVKYFLGWSDNKNKTDIVYPAIDNTTLQDSVHIYAVWKIKDILVNGGMEGTPFELTDIKLAKEPGDPILRNVFTRNIDFKFYEKLSIDIKADVNFEGADVPVSDNTCIAFRIYPGTQPNGTLWNEPYHTDLRVKSYNATSQDVDEDLGPCKNNTKAIIYNVPLYSSYGTISTVKIGIQAIGSSTNPDLTYGCNGRIYNITFYGRTMIY